ncbi:MAG: prepilin-type N-terminal cleavage/methylation domain-containing protein [Casimicrobium sp.]
MLNRRNEKSALICVQSAKSASKKISRPTRQRARGFTLVEVIVAVVIAALALSSLSGVFASGTRGAATAAELARASTLAQSLLASAGVEKPLNDGVESGNSVDGLSWTLTVSEEATESDDGSPIKPNLLLKRVTARVVVPNPSQPDRARSFELTSLRAVPRPPLLQ